MDWYIPTCLGGGGETRFDMNSHSVYISVLRNWLNLKVNVHLFCSVYTLYPIEQRTTPQGQVYFIHRATGVSTWHDPRFRDLDVDPAELEPLGDGWEIRHTAHGRRYFVDHINKTTQFTGKN